MDIDEYITKRVDEQQKYFSKKATDNKGKYELLSIIKLLLSLVISVATPIVGECSVWSIIISIISATIAFIEGLVFIKKYNDKWINYRKSSESIKREKYFFTTKSEKYRNVACEEANDLFVQNIESIIRDSNEKWENIIFEERRK